MCWNISHDLQSSASIFQLLASGDPCMEDQRIMPQTRAQIRSVHECCSPGHEIGNLKVRDYFIWEASLHFVSDVNNKWVEHISSEVCPCCISFSNCPIFLAIREAEHGLSRMTSWLFQQLATAHVHQPEYYSFSSLFTNEIFSAISFSLCLNEITAGFFLFQG